MANTFVNNLSRLAKLSDQEIARLEEATRHGRRFLANRDLIRDDDHPGLVMLVIEGWAIRYKLSPSGERQIISFMMPGDSCDIHIAVLTAMNHRIASLTDLTIVVLSAEQLSELRPTLFKALWWDQLVDRFVFPSTIMNMGHRTSLARIAHLLCELSLRMRSIGLASPECCEMPFGQTVLADAVGMTLVHVNRVVGELRRAGALEVTLTTLNVASLSCLAEIAGLDDRHLYRRRSQL